jgi:hypothetical protein
VVHAKEGLLLGVVLSLVMKMSSVIPGIQGGGCKVTARRVA